MKTDPGHRKSLASADVLARAMGDDAAQSGAVHTTQHENCDKRWISPLVVLSTVRLVDLLIVALAGFDMWAVYVHVPGDPVNLNYLSVILLTSAAIPIIFQSLDLYTVPALRHLTPQGTRLILGWTGMFALLMALAFLTKVGAEFSRVWLIGWYSVGLVMILSARLATSVLVRHWNQDGRLERRAVIVGGGKRGADLIQALEKSDDTDIRITGVFDDRSDERSPPLVAGYPKLGNISELLAFARGTRIDLLIVSLPLTAENRLLEVLRKLWVLPVDIRLSAHTNKLRFRRRSYSFIGDVPFFDVFDKPLADWNYIIKSIEDRVLAAILIVLAAPLMVMVAIAVKLDSPGPVLFRQKRYGFNNEMTNVFKFRSLRHETADAGASRLVTKNDDRVTRVGRFIRKTSLDELPQLFNVLTGDLSLVGPRPHAVMAKAEDKLYIHVVDSYFARHRVKPGITGWAQVNGWRGETDTAEKIQRRVEYDLYYIENWSIWFDLYIIAMTPFSLLNTDSAY